MIDFIKSIELLYTRVDVVTSIKKTRDFESPFLQTSQDKNKPEDNNLIHNQLVYTGYLKVIDPITTSTILCSIEETNVTNNILILGNNICDIRPSPKCDNLVELNSLEVRKIIELDSERKLSNHPYFYRPQSKSSLTPEETARRGEKILAWLKENLIPAKINEDTNEIVIAESARIRPPYEHESDYICPTRIVYKRIKRIIEKGLENHDQ